MASATLLHDRLTELLPTVPTVGAVDILPGMSEDTVVKVILVPPKVLELSS
ncbi:hypothetical protein D3C72_2251790 [compost metagenome]